MRHLLWSLLAVLGLGLANGCGPAVRDEELGEIHDRMPRVPGTEQPYELPQLGAE